MQEVVKAEVIKLLDAGIIYPISDSKWVLRISHWLVRGEFSLFLCISLE
jgi:hypothetical protein